jgi:hypothetical protein
MAKPWIHLGKQYTEEDIRRAMAKTRSNNEAARHMKVDIRTYKKYAKLYIDELSGKNLWQLHMNITGKGIPKKPMNIAMKGDLDAMLTEGQLNNPKRLATLKKILMIDGRLGYACSACSYSQRRLTDKRLPLMLNFKNGIRTDWRQENINWLCYNCCFILGLDYFSNRMIRDIETINTSNDGYRDEIEKFYDIPEEYLSFLDGLGLNDSGDIIMKNKVKAPEPTEGEEFLDFIN